MISRLTIVLPVALVCGCSANLDAECTDFFGRVNTALDAVAAADSSESRTARLRDLESFSAELESLQQRAAQRLSEKIASGELCSELAPRGTECDERLVFDDLNQRKVVALNGFITRWQELGVRRTATAAPAPVPLPASGDDGQPAPGMPAQAMEDAVASALQRPNTRLLDGMLELMFICNNTLR
ncbi:MAG: hypothetical protein R3F42_12480 [Pseudomonadota bacterium]